MQPAHLPYGLIHGVCCSSGTALASILCAQSRFPASCCGGSCDGGSYAHLKLSQPEHDCTRVGAEQLVGMLTSRSRLAMPGRRARERKRSSLF